MSLLKERHYYKPFLYPWAFEVWKAHERMHWLEEEIPMRDDLADWKHMSSNERNLITQIFRFFTQGDCFHPDTEFLSDRGWVTFEEYQKEHCRLAQVSEDAEVSFDFPTNIIEKEYKGPLYRITDGTARTEQLVTENHKIIYWYNNSFKECKAKDFLPYQGVKLKTSGTKDASLKSTLTPLERLWIAFQADGFVASDVSGSKLGYIPHKFSFKKKRKADRLQNILIMCGLEYELKIDSRDYFSFCIKYPLTDKMCKNFSWVDISKMNTQTARDFLEELSYWDSHIDDNGYVSYSNTNKLAVDKVQEVLVISNYHHSFSVYEDDRSEKFNTVYCLGYQPNRVGEVDGQSIRRFSGLEEPYSGKVVCFTMPKGTLVTRFRGKVAFSGNCSVARGYNKYFLPLFSGNPEIGMMLDSFASREATHISAYALLIDTVGMPETEYKAFLEYDSMKNKYEYVMDFNPYKFKNADYNDLEFKKEVAKTLAVYSAFTEGLQLFSSFAILLNFPRQNKMKGMGKVVEWSQKDESIHVDSMIKLFNTFIDENPELWTDSFKAHLYETCRTMVVLEERFIDTCFELGGIEGLTADEVKQYVYYIADRRLLQLGLKPNYGVKKNPLPWIDEMCGIETHTNFFEARSAEYTKGALTGSWEDVWNEKDNKK